MENALELMLTNAFEIRGVLQYSATSVVIHGSRLVKTSLDRHQFGYLVCNSVVKGLSGVLVVYVDYNIDTGIVPILLLRHQSMLRLTNVGVCINGKIYGTHDTEEWHSPRLGEWDEDETNLASFGAPL